MGAAFLPSAVYGSLNWMNEIQLLNDNDYYYEVETLSNT